MKFSFHQYKTRLTKCYLALFILSGFMFTHTAGYAKQSASKTNNTILNFLNPPTNFKWEGAYVGGYIGGAWGHSTVDGNAGLLTETSYFASTENINSVSKNGSSVLNPSAFIGGAQFGTNYIVNNYLVGLVLDYGAFHLSAAHNANNITYPDGLGLYSLHTAESTDWLYTVRGRLGLFQSKYWPVMIYTTGGLAVTNLTATTNFSDTTVLAAVGEGSHHNNQMGWTVGAGFEFPITHYLTINTEYLFLQFKSLTANCSIYNSAAGAGIDYQSFVSPFSTSTNLYANLFKLGLNYKF